MTEDVIRVRVPAEVNLRLVRVRQVVLGGPAPKNSWMTQRSHPFLIYRSTRSQPDSPSSYQPALQLYQRLFDTSCWPRIHESALIVLLLAPKSPTRPELSMQ